MNKIIKSGSLTALLFLAGLIASPAAQAQELLTNPNFASNTLVPWTLGSTIYDSQTATADGSGSAAGTFTTTNGVMNAISQCVTGIVPGSYYNVSGKVLIPAGQTEAGAVRLALSWHDNPSCVNYLQDEFSNQVNIPGAATNTWIPLQGGGVAPPGAQSAWVVGLIYKNGTAAGSLTAKFDDMSLQLAPAGNFVLSVTRSGSGYGAVTGTNIDCGNTGNDCTESLAPNSTITLTAAPSYISVFAGWSGGGCSGTAPTCVVTMGAAQAVNAQFDLAPTFPLTVSLTGTGSGTVDVSGEDGGCNSNCALNIPQNAVLTLTATPQAGSFFAGWSGGGCAGVGNCVVTMNAARSVTAQFSLGASAVSPVPTLDRAALALLALMLGSAAWLQRRRPAP